MGEEGAIGKKSLSTKHFISFQSAFKVNLICNWKLTKLHMYIPYLDCIHTEHVKFKMQCFMGAESHAVSAYQEADETRLLMTSVSGTLEPETIALPHPSPCKEVWTPFLQWTVYGLCDKNPCIRSQFVQYPQFIDGELKSKEGYLLKVIEVNTNYILPFFPFLFG